MVRRIAWREFVEFIRDGRLPLVGGLFAVLLVVSLAVGWRQQSSLNLERSAAQGMDYNDWLHCRATITLERERQLDLCMEASETV
jgi:ABC-2 type transport system permease protein